MTTKSMLVLEAKVTRLSRAYRIASAAEPCSPEAMGTYYELGAAVRMMRVARARMARSGR